MKIHHQVDFVLRIVDSMTERGVKGGTNRFWLDGHPIKPSKVMDSFFVFSNVFSNPSKFHVYSQISEGFLTWDNPFYTSETMILNLSGDRKVIPSDEIFIRALPSELYPFTEEPTGVKGRIEGGEQVLFRHTKSRNHYHLKGAVVNEKYVEMAQSMDRNIEGKTFWFGGGEEISEPSSAEGSKKWADQPFRTVLKDNFGTYVTPPFDKPPSADCDILEVIHVPISPNGQFFMVINDVDGEQDLSGIELEIICRKEKKALKVDLKRGVLTDVGAFKFEEI